MNRTRSIVAISLASALLLVAGCSSSSDDGSTTPAQTGSNKPASVSFDPETGKAVPEQPLPSWCGKKKVKVGVAIGNAVNSWGKTVVKQIELAVAECPSVDGKVLVTYANGDQQTAISQINSQVAQGVDVLVVEPDLGEVELPAIRAAKKAGVVVAIYNNGIGGKAGVDWTARTVFDSAAAGKTVAEAIGKDLSSGNVVFLGGIAGAPSSALVLGGVKDGLAKYPGMKLLTDKPVTTKWTESGAQQAMAGLIAKYPKIDAVITDYGVTASGAIAAFRLANKPVPAIGALATQNKLGCLWEKLATGGEEIALFTVDGTTAMGSFALRQGIAAANGLKYNADQQYNGPLFIDSSAGKKPTCETALPPDADLSSGLTTAQMQEVF